MKEILYQQQLKKQIAEHGFYLVKGDDNATGNGHPDFILCVSGFFVAIECKTNTPLKVNQQKKAVEIIKNGGKFIVAMPDASFNYMMSHYNDLPTIKLDPDNLKTEYPKITSKVVL